MDTKQDVEMMEQMSADHVKEAIKMGRFNFDHIQVIGDLDLSGMTIEGDLDFNEAFLCGDLNLNDATVRGDLCLLLERVRGHMSLTEITVHGDLSIGPEKVGSAEMGDMTVKGKVSFWFTY